MVPLVMRITLSVILKEQSNFIGRLSVQQKRMEQKIQKRVHMATLALCTTLAVILKEQSNSISKYLFVARQVGDDVSEGSVYCSLV